MPIVEVRHIHRSTRQQRERTVVSGVIQVTGRVGSHPVGSYELRHIENLLLTPNTGDTRRAIAGSVRDPNTTYANSVLLRAWITGTSGTRLASIATLGSTPASGAISAAFTAYGH